MALQLGQWKSIAVVAGIAVLALALVLIIGLPAAPDNGTTSNNNTAPDESVVATVNAEEITTEDITTLQRIVWVWYREWVDTPVLLERLIADRVLVQEAVRQDYMPTELEAESELLIELASMGRTREDFEVRLEQVGLYWEEYLVIFRNQLATERYLADVVDVTEEEVRAYYDDMKEAEGEEIEPFEELEQAIIEFLRQRKVFLVIEDLREKADIVYTQSE